ncbi:glycosyltransferase family 4 protein [Thauera humireducens]|uniref:glycosyltransferase family 4 protein n=1 Tax=Thauera humireducens TaxID=1134435 RepID=UPI0009EE2FBE|nr:glycosyltransferase family 4 protein [Thauera humireducens]
MNVLLWSQYFWPESFRINELATALQQHDVQVTVLTGKPNYPEGEIFQGYSALGVQRELYAGIEVVRMPLLPRGNGSPVRMAMNYLSFIFSSTILAPIALRKLHFDVVFVYAPSPILQALPAILLAWLKGAPLVVWVQDLWPESLKVTGYVKNRLALRVVETLVRYIYRRADSILIQSEAFRDSVTRLTRAPEKVRYYPNTAQPFQDENAEMVESQLVSRVRMCFSLVFAGNLGAAQSLETILLAAEYLKDQPDIRFFIIGTGSRGAWLTQEVVRRKLANVVLTGRMPYAEMPAVFAAASALLVTLADSPALALTIPSKLQAYLAAGRPVIASLNGEGANIVKESEAGFTCPAGDAEALAAAVLKLYGLAPSERNRMGSNGRRYFDKHFDPSKRLRELIELFQSLSREKKEKVQ